ncbi:MAG: hypothetical protein AAF493_22660 [Pseudomonadota bacterium]
MAKLAEDAFPTTVKVGVIGAMVLALALFIFSFVVSPWWLRAVMLIATSGIAALGVVTTMYYLSSNQCQLPIHRRPQT